MKTSHTYRLFSLAAVACIAIVSAVATNVVGTWRALKNLAVDIAHSIVTHVAAVFEKPTYPTVAQLVANSQRLQHVARRLKLERQRPRVEASWRMAPST